MQRENYFIAALGIENGYLALYSRACIRFLRFYVYAVSILTTLYRLNITNKTGASGEEVEDEDVSMQG